MSYKLKAINKQRKEMAKELNAENNSVDGILNQDGVSVLRFSANWCGPCRMIAPVFEELADEVQDVTFIKVDTDSNHDLANQYGVRSIPTVVFVDKEGNNLLDHIGATSKDGFKELIKQATDKLNS